MNIIQELEREQMDAVLAKRGIPEFSPGDTVKVMVRVIEVIDDPKDKKKKAAEPKQEASHAGATDASALNSGAGAASAREVSSEIHSSADLLAMFGDAKAADAPMCMTCGTKMRPAGSCYVCEGCGSTSGCS